MIASKNKDGKNVQIWEHRKKKDLPYRVTVNGIVVCRTHNNDVEHIYNNLSLCSDFVFDESLEEYNGCPFCFETSDGFHCVYDISQLDCTFRNDPYN